jgi:6-pyruvoyltetrahydropterin/6-carboxytetrahydropterin synthase
MLYLTKRMNFSAAHRLFNPEFDEQKNLDTFGKCGSPNGHGHNYELEVTVAGVPDPETGFVIDLNQLRRIMDETIVSKVDHANLNVDVPFLSGVIPTVENLAIIFWRLLEPQITSGQLYKIRISETHSSWVEYFGSPSEIKRFKM